MTFHMHAAADCLKSPIITNWERDFLTNIKQRDSITEKQAKALTRICRRARCYQGRAL